MDSSECASRIMLRCFWLQMMISTFHSRKSFSVSYLTLCVKFSSRRRHLIGQRMPRITAMMGRERERERENGFSPVVHHRPLYRSTRPCFSRSASWSWPGERTTRHPLIFPSSTREMESGGEASLTPNKHDPPEKTTRDSYRMSQKTRKNAVSRKIDVVD